MRHRDIVASAFAFFLLMGFGRPLAFAKEKTPTIPASLKGKPYTAARAKILAAGWKPDYRPAVMEADQAIQKLYPELRDCAVDRPLCSLSFVGKNRSCLTVITRGETADEYRVEAVLRECDN
jgi:hypothetical protein